jgi:hypothetical protein
VDHIMICHETSFLDFGHAVRVWGGRGIVDHIMICHETSFLDFGLWTLEFFFYFAVTWASANVTPRDENRDRDWHELSVLS